MNRKSTRRLTVSAVCLALALVLPFLIGQIPVVGKALSPMHIPVFLCGFLCGWPWGLAVGFTAPLLRSVLFGMPAIYPNASGMALELAAYGFFSGLLYARLPKKNGYIYVTLIVSMFAGRLVWGCARYIFAGIDGSAFTFSMFLAGAVTNAIPGIVLHIILIPLLVMALKRAGLMLNDP